jgi:hypothetical protein
MHEPYNPNPLNKLVGDCVVRAITKAVDKSWGEVYLGLCILGYMMADWGSSNQVWGAYLRQHGFERKVIPEDCTVEEFCKDHPEGVYVLGTGSHAVAVVDGKFCDAWDSGCELAIYYYSRSEE